MTDPAAPIAGEWHVRYGSMIASKPLGPCVDGCPGCRIEALVAELEAAEVRAHGNECSWRQAVAELEAAHKNIKFCHADIASLQQNLEAARAERDRAMDAAETAIEKGNAAVVGWTVAGDRAVAAEAALTATKAELSNTQAELATAREALEAIRRNATSWHADEAGKDRALNVIAAWAARPESIPAAIREAGRQALAVSGGTEAEPAKKENYCTCTMRRGSSRTRPPFCADCGLEIRLSAAGGTEPREETTCPDCGGKPLPWRRETVEGTDMPIWHRDCPTCASGTDE